jgi:hypothetical protein
MYTAVKFTQCISREDELTMPPIYAKPVRLLMKDMADAFALQPGPSFTKQQALDWFNQNYSKIKTGTVHCHLIRLSTNAPTRIHLQCEAPGGRLIFPVAGVDPVAKLSCWLIPQAPPYIMVKDSNAAVDRRALKASRPRETYESPCQTHPRKESLLNNY